MCQHVLCEGDGLGVLHVGEARQDGLAVILGDILQGGDEPVDRIHGVECRIPEIHLEVGGHLVVPAPAGVQFASGGTDDIGEFHLDVGVDVLQGVVHLEVSAFEGSGQLTEPSGDGVGILLGDDLAGFQHAHVGEGAHDVIECHPAVDVEGGGELEGTLVHAALEPS